MKECVEISMHSFLYKTPDSKHSTLLTLVSDYLVIT